MSNSIINKIKKLQRVLDIVLIAYLGHTHI
jgi:hypothetical protein